MRDQTGRDGRRGRGPFVRRGELTLPSAADLGEFETRIDRHSQCWVKNNTAGNRQIYEVLRITDVLIDVADNEANYLHQDLYAGTAPNAGDERVVVLQQPAAQGDIRLACQAGVTVARLIGEEGLRYCAPGTGYALVSASEGPFLILHDPGVPDGADAESERLAKVRLSGPDPSGSGTTTGAGVCGCTVAVAGSITLFGYQWSDNYTLALIAPIHSVVVTNQGAYWESADVEVECEAGTDIYRVRMTPTGIGVGEVVITVFMTEGGGYNGDAACCETTPEGWTWTFVNNSRIDPLATFFADRDPDGFTGKECEKGACVVCVSPASNTVEFDCGSRVFDDGTELVIRLPPDPSTGEEPVFVNPPESETDRDDTIEAPEIFVVNGLSFATDVDSCGLASNLGSLNEQIEDGLILTKTSGFGQPFGWRKVIQIGTSLKLDALFNPCERRNPDDATTSGEPYTTVGLLSLELSRLAPTREVATYLYYLHQVGEGSIQLFVQHQLHKITDLDGFDAGCFTDEEEALTMVPDVLTIEPGV